jgi:DMSO/TMAO reductase YedYZ molybdopterin-dependent catalytic subunit
MAITRRNLLLSTAAALLSRAARSAGEQHAGMITLSPRPTDLEMPVDGFVDEITPVELFFVRSHTYIPEVKERDWKLVIDGLVERPLALSLSDLKRFPRSELVGVLECAGNGRSFYNPTVAGAQWRFGSVGNARWSGARLRDVLRKAGLKPGASQLLLDGADVPLGKMPDFQRTLPIDKGLHEDTLLAWEMNGKPLTAQHGFPLRVIAPGWAGDSWIKWLQHIEVLDHEFDGFWMKTAYRHPKNPVAPGTAVDPKDMVPVTDLNVKSVIARPDDWAMPGMVTVQGVAWSNAAPVTKVDVSVDSGTTWDPAILAGKATKYGFRRWTWAWRADEGQHALISRATNAAGQTQPLQEEWNPNGYLWNVAQPRDIVVAKVRSPASLPSKSFAPTPPEVYKTACFGCHDEHMMRQQHLTRAQWDRELTKMTGWGAGVKPENRDAVLDYLSSNFKSE